MMTLDNIEIKLPKTEEAVKKFFENCRQKGRFASDSEEHYKKHFKKAKHDLIRAIAEFQEECWDWTIIKSYYSIHHAANALLSKTKNIFSKDHYCLIVALRFLNLIDETLFSKISSIHNRFSDVGSIDLTFQMRKISQYDVDKWEEITKDDASKILELAKMFINYAEGRL